MNELMYKLDIQYFAEDGTDEKKETGTKSEDKDVIKQEDVDALVARKLAEQKLELEKTQAEALDKAAKLAQMNDDEKRQAELEDREAKLKARELEIERHTLQNEAAKMLQERNLPTDLANYVNYGSAEEITESVKALGKVVEDEVTRRVKEIAKGGTVPGSSKTEPRDASLTARNKKWEERFNL